MLTFHVAGLRASHCYKPGWVEALIAVGTETAGMLYVTEEAHAAALAAFDGQPMLDVAARAAVQLEGCKGCGGNDRVDGV